MSQSKQRSLTEVVCNTLTGLIIAYFVWNWIVLPTALYMCWDMNALLWYQVTTFNVIFTVVSVVRGYTWRRIFNQGD